MRHTTKKMLLFSMLCNRFLATRSKSFLRTKCIAIPIYSVTKHFVEVTSASAAEIVLVAYCVLTRTKEASSERALYISINISITNADCCC